MLSTSSLIHMPFFVFRISSFITLHTDCLIDIFASPNLSTITLTKLEKLRSFGFMYSIINYKIFSVIPTIFGLLSFSIFIKLGSNDFIELWNSGLSILDCTLKSSYSAVFVFYFIDPYKTMLPKNLACVGSFSIIEDFLFSFFIELLIFYSLRCVVLWLEFILIVSRSLSIGS